ncbi:hypothetical protein H8K35_08240 [Undibacterium sp. LX40W]|uniref:Uncharacterized protein n=1 Tax=Undibacterium nitidum TaxID=2762298 RepID=A0A923HM54_9BURK|nr:MULTISPECIES: hypothetical protein [Undibacterium]MBC3881577.1 hypothetical protein [Undibacterium nitidum]MBC3891641.1 hypothetical protein [Undibacterium sp. LX40W]
MKMMTTKFLINAEERNSLVAEELLQLSPYDDNRPFVLGLNARPLAALFDAAICGSRVYELMKISRPADLFHYLYLDFVDIDPSILRHVQNFFGPRARFDVMPFLGGMKFLEFDRCFSSNDDGPALFCRCWLEHRESDFWDLKLLALLDLTKRVQHRLRLVDDLLLKNEISLIDDHKHRRDFLVKVERISERENTISLTTSLPLDLYQTIVSLVKENKVNSVSCPLTDYALWRFLVEEQMRRAQSLGQEPSNALFLSGCGGGTDWGTADWGGDVHVLDEGVFSSELFIKPDWHNFRREFAGIGGSLHQASYTSALHYMLTKEDFGELECAIRTEIGDWILYENKVRLVFSSSP